jgi:drug/metabolite transporter (DMT)-like permease
MNTIKLEAGRRQRSKAQALLAATAALWSLGGLFIKMVEWNPLAIAGMRSAIAALLMLTVVRKSKITWSFHQIGGAVAYAGTVILFVSANKMTTAANAILLQYTAPIYVALLGAWLLKERTKILDWITIAFVLGGMVLFFLDHLSTGGMIGNLVAILSGVTFAFLVIFLRLQKDGAPLESMFLGNILTALIGLPFMFQSMPSGKSWAGLAILGIFQLGLSYILYSMAIKHVTALEAILVPVIEPILNPVWVFLFMREVPGKWALTGGLIVLLAVTARCVYDALKKEKEDIGKSSDVIKKRNSLEIVE